MKLQFDLMLMISLTLVVACVTQGKDTKASTATDAAAGPGQSTRSDPDTPAIASDPGKADYPYQVEWIPGQRDSGEFDVLSKFRAHANRVAKDVLVLKLNKLAKGLQPKGTTSKYVVADSTVVTGLLPNELFTNNCKIGSGSSADGQIGGIPSTAIWDQWQHPRLAWRFDTLTVEIRSITPDSVSCILVQRDD